MKPRSSAQYAYKIQTVLDEKYLFRGQKSLAEDPQSFQKNQKKLVTDVSKDSKTSLERIRVTPNAFSCANTVSRGTFRGIVGSTMFPPVFFMTPVFLFKMLYQYAQEVFLFLTECFLLLIKLECATELFEVYQINGTRF